MQCSERAGRKRTAWIAVAAFGALAILVAPPRELAPHAINASHSTSDTSHSASHGAAGNSSDANTARAERSTFGFEVILHGHDEHYLSPWLFSPRFGPNGAGLVGYETGLLERDDGSRLLRWWGSRAAGTLVVAGWHLRRVRVRANHPMRIAMQGLSMSREKDVGGVHSFGGELPSAMFVDADAEHAGHASSSISIRWTSNVMRVRIGGSVVTPSGTPPASFGAVLSRGNERQSGTTHPDGTFEFLRVEVGDYLLCVGDKDGNTATVPVHLTNADVQLSVPLTARPKVRGRVVDATGAPAPNADLVWWTDDGDYEDFHTNDDGTFVIAVRETATGSLWALSREGYSWPVVGVTARPDAEAVTLVIPRDTCRGAMHVTVPALPNLPERSVSARLWQSASGLGMELQRTRCDDTSSDFAATDLPAGRYTLELLSPAFGAIDAGTFWCDGKTDVALPRVELPRLCRVAISVPSEDEPKVFELVRTSPCDFPVRLCGPAFVDSHWLAPGDYEIWWKREGPWTRSLAFTIARDQRELTLTLQ